MKRLIVASLVSLAMSLVLVAPVQAQLSQQLPPQYSIAVLPSLRTGNVSMTPAALNDNGYVAGWDYTSGSPARTHAVVYDGSTVTDLGTFGGNTSIAYDINNSNQVVGYAETSTMASSQYIPHPFLWSGGSLIDLIAPDTFSAWNNGSAVSINDSGIVIGKQQFTIGGSSIAHNYSYNAATGVVTDLDSTFPSGRYLDTITNFGQIAGSWGPTGQGFISVGTSTYEVGTISGGTNSFAYGANLLGCVVGQSDVGSGSDKHAFYWKPDVPFGTAGTLLDLGTLSSGINSQAAAINAYCDIVGSSYLNSTSTGNPHGFIWHWGVMYDLNDYLPSGSNWIITEAIDINDKGQITGRGLYNGNWRSFIMTPIP